MPSYYETVGEEPTYRFAESVIKAIIHGLKEDSKFYETYLKSSSYGEYPAGAFYRFVGKFPTNKQSDAAIAIHLVMKYFPDVLKKRNNALYIKESDKHLLEVNDLLIMDYYMLLLNQYAERVNKYQRYLKKQEDKQHLKFLFVLLLPFILLILMILAGD